MIYEENSGHIVLFCDNGYSYSEGVFEYSKTAYWIENYSVVKEITYTREGYSHYSGTIADLNQDGWIDHIYSIDEVEGEYIKTFCNIKLGNGDTFGEAIRLGEFDCGTGTVVIDLDGDGDLDISSDYSITYDQNGEYISYSGRSTVGNTQFYYGECWDTGMSGCYNTFWGPHILSDVDNDGDLDRIVGKPGSGGFDPVSIHWNPAFPDDDGDGVDDRDDLCLSTNSGAAVDAQGCSDSERDTDQDGVTDDADLCGSTPPSAEVDSDGCADTQKDTDGDGVSDAIDQCLETPEGSSVNLNGCAMSEIDSDTDGIVDADDDCPNTGDGSVVDSNGCADDDIVDLDGDNDGVRDSVDLCPNTSGGSVIDVNGCEIIYTPPPDNSGSNSNEESDSQGESDGGGFWSIFCCIIVVLGILGAIGAMQHESGSDQFAVNVQQHTPVNVQQTVVVQQPVVQPQPVYQPAPVPVQTTPTVVKETKSSQEQVVGEAVSQYGDAVTGTKITNDAEAITRAASRAAIEAYRMGQSDAKQDTKPRCKSCQSPVEANWKFCVHCNESLP